jgi:hypothetical protein
VRLQIKTTSRRISYIRYALNWAVDPSPKALSHPSSAKLLLCHVIHQAMLQCSVARRSAYTVFLIYVSLCCDHSKHCRNKINCCYFFMSCYANLSPEPDQSNRKLTWSTQGIRPSAGEKRKHAIFPPQPLGAVLSWTCKELSGRNHTKGHRTKDAPILSDRAYASSRRGFLPRGGNAILVLPAPVQVTKFVKFRKRS